MRLRIMRTGVGARGVTRRLRVFALAFALLQIGLQGLFAVSDGYEARASAKIAGVHTEAPGTPHHRIHGDDCAVCHVLATGSIVPPRAPPLCLRAIHIAAVPSATVARRPFVLVPGARRARAPPLPV